MTALTAVVASTGGNTLAQGPARLAGPKLVVAPEFEPERLPIAFGEEKPVAMFTVGGPTRATSLAYSPDGRTLASAGYGLALWDLRVALEPNPDEGHLYTVNSLAYSPDGRTLASGSADRTVKLWDLEGRRPKATLHGHDEGIVRLAYAPDGRSLASGDEGGVIKVWDASRAGILATFRGHSTPINALVYSPDGKTIASGSGYSDEAGCRVSRRRHPVGFAILFTKYDE